MCISAFSSVSLKHITHTHTCHISSVSNVHYMCLNTQLTCSSVSTNSISTTVSCTACKSCMISPWWYRVKQERHRGWVFDGSCFWPRNPCTWWYMHLSIVLGNGPMRSIPTRSERDSWLGWAGALMVSLLVVCSAFGSSGMTWQTHQHLWWCCSRSIYTNTHNIITISYYDFLLPWCYLFPRLVTPKMPT